jgi:hypothetical protein
LEDETIKGRAHGLSCMIKNEFFSLCGDQLILQECEEAIDNSIIVHAFHEEKNVFILRRISQRKKNEQFRIKKRFVEFSNFNER